MARTVPNCNRSFLINALLENKRVDGRSFQQFRDLQVNFGQTFGTCYVQLGHTVVYASTEATVDEPRISRPSEGRFKVAINISAGGKERWLRQIERSQPKEAVITIRLLEKIINRINVLDLESLCLVTGRSVWCISTNIVLLNFDGNLIEAASIATIASLMHFRRPDATVTPEGDIIVHSFEERNPIPLTLFHYPICVTFQFMDHTMVRALLSESQEGDTTEKHQLQVKKALQLAFCDPTEEEEEFLHNVLVICANTFREIVAIQSIGRISLSSFTKKLLDSCSKQAFVRVKFVTDYLKSQLERHNPSSASATASAFHRYGFLEAMKNGDLCIVKDYMRNPIFGTGNSFTLTAENSDAHIGEGGVSKWLQSDDINSDEEQDNDEEEIDEDEAEKITEEVKSFSPAKETSSYAHITNPNPVSHNRVNTPVETAPRRQIKVVPVEGKTGHTTPKPEPKANAWVQVASSRKPETNQTGKKKRKRGKKGNQAQNTIKNPFDPSDDEDDPVQLLSEFSKK